MAVTDESFLSARHPLGCGSLSIDSLFDARGLFCIEELDVALLTSTTKSSKFDPTGLRLHAYVEQLLFGDTPASLTLDVSGVSRNMENFAEAETTEESTYQPTWAGFRRQVNFRKHGHEIRVFSLGSTALEVGFSRTETRYPLDPAHWHIKYITAELALGGPRSAIML
jgi:hypothetical protein